MIELALESLPDDTKMLDPKMVKRALALANNKTAQKARTLISKEIRKEFNVTARTLKDHTQIKYRGGKSGTDVLIFYKGKRISLRHFDAVETKVLSGVGLRKKYKNGKLKSRKVLKRRPKSTGVRVKLQKSKGAELAIGSGRFGSSSMLKRMAFFGSAKNSRSQQVFVRDETKGSRKQLTKLTGPSVAQMVSNTTVKKRAFDFIAKEHHQQFQTHLQKLQEGIIK